MALTELRRARFNYIVAETHRDCQNCLGENSIIRSLNVLRRELSFKPFDQQTDFIQLTEWRFSENRLNGNVFQGLTRQI